MAHRSFVGGRYVRSHNGAREPCRVHRLSARVLLPRGLFGADGVRAGHVLGLLQHGAGVFHHVRLCGLRVRVRGGIELPSVLRRPLLPRGRRRRRGVRRREPLGERRLLVFSLRGRVLLRVQRQRPTTVSRLSNSTLGVWRVVGDWCLGLVDLLRVFWRAARSRARWTLSIRHEYWTLFEKNVP